MLGQTMAESSAVGSALRSGRRGRAFESPLSDKKTTRLSKIDYLSRRFSVLGKYKRVTNGLCSKSNTLFVNIKRLYFPTSTR